MRVTFIRIIASALFISIAISFVTVPFTAKKAYAVVPVTDVGNAPTHALNFTENLLSYIEDIFEWAQSFILEALKRRLLNMMNDMVLKAVQGGGTPAFITNWSLFSSNVVNIANNSFFNEVKNTNYCSNFSTQLKLLFKGTAGGVSGTGNDILNSTFQKASGCTLDQTLRNQGVNNIQDFYTGFQGGFRGYLAARQPQNTFMGSLITGMDKNLVQASEFAGSLGEEVKSNGGFLSTRRGGKITTPGSLTKDLVSKTLGSDIDYLVNAQQLAAFVGALVNTVASRLISSGEAGLLGLGTGNAPPDGFFTGQGLCAGLTGADLLNCEAAQNASNASQSGGKDSALSMLQDTRSALQDADTAVTDSTARFTAFRNSLIAMRTRVQAWQTQSPPNNVCLDGTDIAALVTDLTAAIDGLTNNSIPSLQQTKTVLQADITELTNAITQIQGFSADDPRIQQIIQGISSRLNPPLAQTRRNSAQQANAEIQTEIQDNQLPSRVTGCIGP